MELTFDCVYKNAKKRMNELYPNYELGEYEEYTLQDFMVEVYAQNEIELLNDNALGDIISSMDPLDVLEIGTADYNGNLPYHALYNNGYILLIKSGFNLVSIAYEIDELDALAYELEALLERSDLKEE